MRISLLDRDMVVLSHGNLDHCGDCSRCYPTYVPVKQIYELLERRPST